jgi:hypothetical protein
VLEVGATEEEQEQEEEEMEISGQLHAPGK